MKKTFGRIFVLTIILTFVFLTGMVVGQNQPPQQPVCETESCQNMETEILNSTVRIYLEVWRMKEDESGFEIDEVMGHATLVEDRYLITHNHFQLLEEADSPDSSMRVVVYDTAGARILAAPLTDFNILAVGDQTLIFEMKLEMMRRQFAEAGIRSARIDDWHGLQIKPGDVVAQVNWDGDQTWVQWSAVEAVVTEEGVPHLLLGNGTARGSSGGGVFLNGVHIANNWQTIDYTYRSGQVAYSTSTASLNPVLSVRANTAR